VLLIDDDPDDFFIFSSALKSISESICVIHESNGKEALEKLNVHTLQPDIIFLDLNMPIMTGQEFLMKYSTSHSVKKVPVIIYSTFISSTTISLMSQLGAADFVSKPERIENIHKELKRIMGINN
jgi:CheY-like chemotaxis protein